MRDSLKQALRGSPDPKEVQTEMNRDKDYGVKTRRMKKKAVRERLQPTTGEGADEGVKASSEQSVIIKRMQAKIEVLKKKMDANVSQASCVQTQAPVHPAVETASKSSGQS